MTRWLEEWADLAAAAGINDTWTHPSVIGGVALLTNGGPRGVFLATVLPPGNANGHREGAQRAAGSPSTTYHSLLLLFHNPPLFSRGFRFVHYVLIRSYDSKTNMKPPKTRQPSRYCD